jgi:hypothetical protein
MTYPAPPPGRHHIEPDAWPQNPSISPGMGQGPAASYPAGRDGVPTSRRPSGWDNQADHLPPYPPQTPYAQPPYAQPPDPYLPQQPPEPAAAAAAREGAEKSDAEKERWAEQWADVRRLVALEVKAVNAKHCHHAFDLLGKRGAVSPNGVILFYSAPDPDPHSPYGYKLYKVTRLAFAGPEYDDLPRMLRGLRGAAEAAIARAEQTGRRWDPRGPESSLVNGGDMDMPRDAVFVGTAAETLHTDEGDWYTVARSILNQPLGVARPRSVFDLTGQGFVRLIDGTIMHVVRDNNRRILSDGVRSNKSMASGRTYFGDRYPELTTEGDTATRAAWTELTNLHNTLNSYLTGPTDR